MLAKGPGLDGYCAGIAAEAAPPIGARHGAHARARLAPGYRRWMVLGALGCVAAALIGEYRFGSSLYLYTDLKDKPGAFQGSMTVVSAFLMLTAAVFFWRIRERLPAPVPATERRGFGVFAGLLVFLAFDELAMFHEWATQKLAQWSVWKPFGIDQDLYVFAVYGVVALAAGVWMWPTLRRHLAPLPLLLWTITLAVGSEAVDFVPWDSLTPMAQTWLGPLEEGLKVLATLSATLYAHALLDEVDGAPAAR